MVGRVTYSGSRVALYGLKVNSLVSGGVKGIESRIFAIEIGSPTPAARAESLWGGSESARRNPRGVR